VLTLSTLAEGREAEINVFSKDLVNNLHLHWKNNDILL